MYRYFRVRFSMKTLLFGVFLLSIILASFSVQAARARRQANAVKILSSAGATIYYDFQRYYRDDFPSEGDWCIDPSRKAQDLRWLRTILGDDFFSGVYSVEFIGRLYWKSPPGTFFGPEPVATELSLNPDRYIELLAAIPSLSHLSLDHSYVSDASIPALGRLKHLKSILLQGTFMTEEGAARLQKLLPDCEIYWRHGRPIKP